jgi:hypothetical protein
MFAGFLSDEQAAKLVAEGYQLTRKAFDNKSPAVRKVMALDGDVDRR